LNTLKQWLLATVAAVVVSTASATVVMTDGTLVVYDPNETYVASGVLGPAPAGRISSFSIGWTYADPSYINQITVQAPSDLVGYLLLGVSAGIDGSGLTYGGAALLAGESVSIAMGGFPQASISKPVSQWFSMVARDMPTPIAFGPGVGGGNVVGLPNDNLVSPVPEPSMALLFGAGLLAVASVTKRRRHKLYE